LRIKRMNVSRQTNIEPGKETTQKAFQVPKSEPGP
jgi:hypothetical protein